MACKNRKCKGNKEKDRINGALNRLIIWRSGSGKTYSARKEIAENVVFSDDDVIIISFNPEYKQLVKRLKGRNINVANNLDTILRSINSEDRLVSLDMSDFKDENQKVKTFVMLSVINTIYNYIDSKDNDKRVWIYIENIDLLFSKKLIGKFSSLYKKAEEKNAIINAMAQSLDTLDEEVVNEILTNSGSMFISGQKIKDLIPKM